MRALVKSFSSLVVATLCLWIQPGFAETVTVDFDDLTPDAPVSALGGVTITDNIIGFDLIVATGLITTSGDNYLGVDDGGAQSFLGGDVLTFTFDEVVTSFSLTAITTPVFPEGALTLSGGDVADTNGAPAGVLPPTLDEFFVLTIANPAGFMSATLSAAFGVFAFNLDDLIFETLDDGGPVVPLPGAFILMLTGLTGLGGAFRRRNVQRNNAGENSQQHADNLQFNRTFEGVKFKGKSD